MTSQFEMQIHRLRRGISAVEFVYTSHDRWPLSRRQAPTGSRLNISVLDSSFNPPTLAHLALADTPYPQCFKSTPRETDGFHAKLLLLSVRNADKVLKPSDATLEQRLEMMILLAKDICPDRTFASSGDQSGEQSEEWDDANVAVAIIDEPTFVGKSNTLLASLRQRISHLSSSGTVEPEPRTPASALKPSLAFLVGMDTLDRLFAARYYPSEESMHSSLRYFFSPDGDDSRVICARRLGLQEDPAVVEARTLDAAKEYIGSQRIALVDINETMASFSSSEVRGKISNSDSEATWMALVTQSIAEYIRRKKLYLHLTSYGLAQ